jgi:hypothetical protein
MLPSVSAGCFAVIDFGAGFLDAAGTRESLSRHTSVSLAAPIRVAYERMRKRRPSDPRRFEQYAAEEFSPARTALHQLTTFTVNADGTAEELGRRSTRLLVGVFTNHLPKTNG